MLQLDGDWVEIARLLPQNRVQTMSAAAVFGPFAGLADGQLWESRDRGDSWTPLQLRGGALDALVALALAMHYVSSRSQPQLTALHG